MDDMQVVLVLLMAMQCDGATMVTITTLVSSHTQTHTQKGRHGKRDSGGMRPPHNTTMWWLVGVAHDQPKSLMTAKCHHQHTHKVVEPHNTQKHHTAMPICNQAHTNAKAVECQASAISPTLASTNPTTTPSTTNNKQEGRRKKDEWWHKATSAHVHKSKPTQWPLGWQHWC